MHVYFGTVVRAAPVTEGGELIKVNWSTKRIERRVPIVPDNPSVANDPNPRGNTRGCRGVQVVGDKVLAASYHTIEVFDKDLNRQAAVSDGLMVGLHETSVDGDRLWVTSTSIDAAVAYELQTGQRTEMVFPRDSAALREALDLEPQNLNRDVDHRLRYLDSTHTAHSSHLHLNAIAQWEGRNYALFHAKGAVVDLTRGEEVLRDPSLVKAHNLVIREDGIGFVNDTYRMTLKVLDLRQKRIVRSLPLRKLGAVRWIVAKTVVRCLARAGAALGRNPRSYIARPLFLRGLAVDGDLAWLGFSPATILCMNWQTGKPVDLFQYSNDVRACVHGLAVAS